MISFIIYEDDLKMINKYVNIVNKFMLNKNCDYKILTFDKYDVSLNDLIKNSLSERRVYMLDVEVSGMNGIDLAREIRKNGDWISQIIILTAYEEKNYFFLTNRLLTLNFIFKKNFNKELLLSLDIIWKIFSTDSILSFKYNGEIFNIFYNDICYIEKNLYNNDATIVTKRGEYIIRSSINNLVKNLNHDARFFKTHRSCIVNLDNVCKYNIESNIITFRDREINLVARGKKKEFENLLLEKK
ncbi:MAG: response regulator transcription factor [Bacilli bacterium]|nr:response regulator transcription factor [Bacilli bacterium]